MVGLSSIELMVRPRDRRATLAAELPQERLPIIIAHTYVSTEER